MRRWPKRAESHSICVDYAKGTLPDIVYMHIERRVQQFGQSATVLPLFLVVGL